MEKLSLFIVLIQTPDLPRFNHMFGANLGYLLYEDVSCAVTTQVISALISPLSPIGSIQILTGILGSAIFDCVIRSCNLFDWHIQTVIPIVITPLELLNVLAA